MLNSRLGLFTAAPSGPKTLTGHPFSRSYGVILPSSLTRVLPSTLGFSPRLPVSVYGTGTLFLLEAFLGSVRSRTSVLKLPSPSQPSLQEETDLPISSASLLGRAQPVARFSTLLRPPVVNGTRWYRNLNLLSIAYAFRPRLRSRLTLSGRTFLRKP